MTTMLRAVTILPWLILMILVASCGAPIKDPIRPSPQPSQLATATLETAPTHDAARELLRITGTGAPFVSSPLQLSEAVTLRVHWEQTSKGEFTFSLAEANGGQLVTPYEMIFELAIGPSSGSGEADFPAGAYVAQVAAADGPWLIWVETVDEP